MSDGQKIILASESGVVIHSFSDISNAVGSTFGSEGLILTEQDVSPDFFRLRTGLAGELFQKFSNYKLRLALVLPDFAAHGERFSELAYEHSTHNQIRFVHTLEEAKDWLAQ